MGDSPFSGQAEDSMMNIESVTKTPLDGGVRDE